MATRNSKQSKSKFSVKTGKTATFKSAVKRSIISKNPTDLTHRNIQLSTPITKSKAKKITGAATSMNPGYRQ